MNKLVTYHLNFISNCKHVFVLFGFFLSVGLFANPDVEVDSLARPTVVSEGIFVKSGTTVLNIEQIKTAEVVWAKEKIKPTKAIIPKKSSIKKIEPKINSEVVEKEKSEPVFVYRSSPSQSSIFAYHAVGVDAIVSNSNNLRIIKNNISEYNIFPVHSLNQSDSSETNNPYFLLPYSNDFSAYSWKSRPPPFVV